MVRKLLLRRMVLEYLKILNDTDINGILIGDDLSMVIHGNENTINCDVETIAMHTRRAVKKGAKR